MKRKVNHHRFEWTFTGAAIVLGTMACSFSLPDISNLPRLAILAVALGAIFLCAKKLSIPRSLGALSFALFVLLAAISTLWAVNKAEGLYDAARWIVAAGLFLTFHHLYRRHSMRTVVMLSRVAVVIILVSLVVAIQQLVQLDGDLRWDNRYSIVSLYTHKGSFSLLLLLSTMPIVMRLKAFHKRGLANIFYWILLALVAGMLLFLSARTALLALAALGAVLLLSLIPLRPFISHLSPYTLLTALMLGLAILGGTRLFCRLPLGDTPGDKGGVLSSATIVERHALWNTTLRLVDRHPALGVGVGNWKVCYPEVSTRDIFSVDVLDFTFVRPHNDYLRVLSETGYVGFVLFILALAAPITRAIGRTARRRRTDRITGTALAYVASVLVAAGIDFPFDRTELLLWCTIAFAILSASTHKELSSLRRRYLKLPLRLIMVTLMVGVVLLATQRMASEKLYPVVTATNHAQQWNRMEQAAHMAQTPWCNLTPTGTPFAYYEAMAQEKQGLQPMNTFAKALHDSPYHKQSLNDMGRLIYICQHDADSAESLFRKAIEVSPSFSYAYFNLAQLYLQEGKPDKAREVLMDYNPDEKQQRIDRLVWHYLSGSDALYYQHQAVAAERQLRDRMLQSLFH